VRTDHVSAWLIKQWLQENAPELAAAWDFQPDDQIIAFAAKIELLLSNVRPNFTGQNILAKTAIEMWNLQDVALLAGGAPTPLSPRPDHLLYYTDGNAEAVEEARRAGYHALHVNVTDSGGIAQLKGAKNAIATGLFHFLPDAVMVSVLSTLDQHGFESVSFSHGTPEAAGGLIEQYEKLGIQIFLRDWEQTQALLPPGWQIDYRASGRDYMRNAGEIGAKLAETPSVFDFYKASKQG